MKQTRCAKIICFLYPTNAELRSQVAYSREECTVEAVALEPQRTKQKPHIATQNNLPLVYCRICISQFHIVSLYSIPFSLYSILVSKWVNFCLGKHDLNCAQQQYNEYWMVDDLHSVADWLVWVPWQSRRRCATHWPRSTGTEDETTINVELDGCQFTKLRYRWCRQLVDINQRCLSWVLRLSIKFLDKNVLDMFISSVYVVAFKNLAVNMHVTLQLVSTWKNRSTYIWMNKWWIWSGSSVMLIGPQNDSNARPANKFQATTISPSSSSF